jgi:hypothetical protein
MQRLAARGKGILLLHDIQARTVAALPRILQDMKARGYRIVHVVPATPDNPATPTDPQQWRLNPTSELVATSRWPKVPTFAFAQHEALPAPLLTDSYWNDIKLLDRPQARGRGIPLPRQAPWPRQVQLASSDAASGLPVPAASVFEVEEGLSVAMLAVNAARPAERVVMAATEEKPAPLAVRSGKRLAGAHARGKRVAAAPQPRHPQLVHQTGRTAAKRAIPDRKNGKRGIHRNQEASLQPSPG